MVPEVRMVRIIEALLRQWRGGLSGVEAAELLGMSEGAEGLLDQPVKLEIGASGSG